MAGGFGDAPGGIGDGAPNPAYCSLLLGQICRAANRTERAVEHFQRALRICPTLWVAWQNLCQACPPPCSPPLPALPALDAPRRSSSDSCATSPWSSSEPTRRQKATSAKTRCPRLPRSTLSPLCPPSAHPAGLPRRIEHRCTLLPDLALAHHRRPFRTPSRASRPPLPFSTHADLSNEPYRGDMCQVSQEIAPPPGNAYPLPKTPVLVSRPLELQGPVGGVGGPVGA